MVNNITICTVAFLLTEISILQTKIFSLQIIQSLFIKAIICFIYYAIGVNMSVNK